MLHTESLESTKEAESIMAKYIAVKTGKILENFNKQRLFKAHITPGSKKLEESNNVVFTRPSLKYSGTLLYRYQLETDTPLITDSFVLTKAVYIQDSY